MVISGKTSLWQLVFRKTHRYFGKNLFPLRCLWGSWQLLRLRSAVNSGKNPPWGKTFRKNPLILWGKPILEKPTFSLGGKKNL